MADVRSHEPRLVEAPTGYPVTTIQAKNYCGASGDIDDTQITAMVAAACKYWQEYTGHQLLEATYEQKWDGFPGEFRLGMAPLLDWSAASVESVKYYDVNGTLQTVAASNYWVSPGARPPRIVLADGATWPDVQAGRPESVIVQYIAGYGSAAEIDEGITRAIMLLVNHWYKRRDLVVAEGGIPKSIPHSFDALAALYSYRGYW